MARGLCFDMVHMQNAGLQMKHTLPVVVGVRVSGELVQREYQYRHPVHAGTDGGKPHEAKGMAAFVRYLKPILCVGVGGKL